MAATNQGVNIQQPTMPIFNGENYDYWSLKMKTLFQSQDLWDLVKSGYDESTNLTNAQKEALKETKKKDAKALFFIQQAISESLFPRIMRVAMTKEAWEVLQEEFQGNSKSHEQRLMRHSEKSIESALQCKLNLNKKESPSQSYNGGVSSRGGMFNRGRGRGQRGRGKSNYNRYLGDASQSNKCEICKRSSHTEKDCWFKGKPQCHHCKKFGHLQKDCRFKNQQQVNVSEEKEDGYAVFYANCQVTNEKSSTTWLLDSGCSNHMTGDNTIFTKIDKSITVEVKMVNGILVQARGKGTICIQTKDGIRYINDVLLVPDLDQNLLSVGQLIENGYAAYFENGTCTIFDKNKGRKLVTKIQMKRGRSFQLMFNYDADLALKAHLKDESLLWHKRLGHIHSQGLKELKNMVYGLPQVEDNNEVCEGCAMGKHHRNSFPKGGLWRAGGLLELVHTNVCGPMRTPSLAENRCIIPYYPCKDLMLNFKFQNFGKVYLTDDKTLDIVGMGDINLKTSLRTSWILKDISYCSWREKRTLYIVEESSYEANIDADEIGSLSLWYKRPSYMSEKGMKLLTSKGDIPELKNVEIGFCEPWFLGKKKCVTFTKSGRTLKTKKLELVHTYVYGPTTVALLDKSLYYVTIINDFTKKIWVYFLKNKSDVFSTFKKWKTEVENLTGLKVKSLMSDNGGEYSSNEYKSYCIEFGIRMIKNILETPQQNGVTECMNRTLNERANSMRLHAGLPKMF
ncbi:uncharacterized protein LOC141703433 [Apium graveolens]|uniref:uncharacterized protein LOC141703433 n=1 Tax=Apium graveolens TaxID=4045 RepID=UPI003D7BA3F8